jgi:hypothetical protein
VGHDRSSELARTEEGAAHQPKHLVQPMRLVEIMCARLRACGGAGSERDTTRPFTRVARPNRELQQVSHRVLLSHGETVLPAAPKTSVTAHQEGMLPVPDG